MNAIHREWLDSQAEVAAQRSCAELGVCHGRVGAGCTCHRDPAAPTPPPARAHWHDTHALAPGRFFLAPGVIERAPPRRRTRVRRAIVNGALAAAALAAMLGWLALSVPWGLLR